MKNLIVLLMSFQMIVGPVAMAEDDGAPPPVVDAHYETGLGSTGGYDFYLKQIGILGTSIIGANILSQCPKGVLTPSVGTYMAGSLAYIASELWAADTVKNNHKKKMSDVRLLEENMATKGGELQKEALIQARIDEKAALDYIKTKRNWMLAITSIYTAAAGMAVAEGLLGIAAGAVAGGAECGGICGPTAPICGPACLGFMTTGGWVAQGNFFSPKAPQKGSAACAFNGVFAPACEAYLKSYLSIAYVGCSPGNLVKSDALNYVLVLAIMTAWGFLSGQMEGGGISKWGIMLSGLLFPFIKTANKLVTAAYNFPIPRAITFGASAALGTSVTTGLIQRQGMTEKNIETLDRVIAEFELTTEEGDGGGLDVGETDYGEAPPPENGGIKSLADGVKPLKRCLGASREFSSAACDKPLQVKAPKFNFGDGLSALNIASGLAADLANAAASGNTERANAIAGELGGMAGRLRDINEKLKKKFNEKLKAEGKAPLDFDKDIKAKVAGLEGSLAQLAASNGINTGASGARATITDEDKKSEGVKGATGTTPVAAAGAPGLPKFDLGLDDFDSPPSEFDATEKTASNGNRLEQFETEEADINKNKDVSIFLQLSNRYLLNYRKMFEKKKKAPKAAEK